ncbi:hypothetical protein B0H34DRAFT_695372 [Crassisporium funariophilum]|nr:hypothetical protein B0H34DRAFT_695372 [Crassisporium funariophilum]
MSASVTQSQKSPPTYEFTKRKRWADLLATELVDAIAFVLSPTCKILYVGTAVTELLGWRDVDLVDFDFMELVNTADRDTFKISFDDSKQNKTQLLLHLQLKSSDSPAPYPSSSSSKYVQFELKLYPQQVSDDDPETNFFFATAVPYPCRNAAMLNTLLDLKAENDFLQSKVVEYRSRAPTDAASAHSPLSQGTSMYATSSLHPPRSLDISGTALQKPAEPPSSFLISSSLTSGLFTEPTSSAKDTSDISGETFFGSNSSNGDDGDEGSKKKKVKRVQNAEQYVCITCGRTDSPEWRKGPLGPKTLCNACGLRWAKQMRKTDEPLEGVASTATNADPDV